MSSITLFEDISIAAPQTEGIKYAGSKLKLLPYILQLAVKVKPRSILDGFSGTTRVAQALAQGGYRVIINDIAVWSKVFGTCYLLSPHPRSYYRELIHHLNALSGKDGWFTERYGGEILQNGGPKKPWQIHNTRRLDAIREEIQILKLDPVSEAVALTSLILALDRVDSTLGHYVSYLNAWAPRAYGQLELRVPKIIEKKDEHEVEQKDIFELLANVEVDLAYFDPPYGSNNDKMPPSRVRYASYYHIWTTICLFDKPSIFGKASRRVDSSDTLSASIFEEFRRGPTGRFIVIEAIERLLQEVNAKYIILSYSSGGRATSEELIDVISKVGKLIEIIEVDYKSHVMADMSWTSQWSRPELSKNKEYLFLIEK